MTSEIGKVAEDSYERYIGFADSRDEYYRIMCYRNIVSEMYGHLSDDLTVREVMARKRARLYTRCCSC